MQTTRILVAPKAPVGGTVKLKGYTVPAAQLPHGILITPRSSPRSPKSPSILKSI